VTPGVVVGPVVAGHGVVQLEPLGQRVGIGRPDHRGVVAVPNSEHPAGRDASGHGGKEPDRIGDVLDDLMGVDDVEAPVHVVERGDPQVELGVLGERAFDDRGRRVDADHRGRAHHSRQVGGDRRRTAPDIQQRQPGAEVGQEVRRRVRRRPPPVRPQHRAVVAVGVGAGHGERVVNR
jgi:hypothetical protein